MNAVCFTQRCNVITSFMLNTDQLPVFLIIFVNKELKFILSLSFCDHSQVFHEGRNAIGNFRFSNSMLILNRNVAATEFNFNPLTLGRCTVHYGFVLIIFCTHRWLYQCSVTMASIIKFVFSVKKVEYLAKKFIEKVRTKPQWTVNVYMHTWHYCGKENVAGT